MTLSLLLIAATVQSGAEVPPVGVHPVEELLLRAAGVELRAGARGAQAGRLELSELGDARWVTDATGRRSSALFLPIPGHEAIFGEPALTAPSGGAAEWRWELGHLAWREDVRLILEQVGDGPLLRGTLRLAAPNGPFGAPLERVLVQRVLYDCPVTAGFQLPIELGHEPAELPFVWDLHNPITTDGSYLVLGSSEHGTLPRVPVDARIHAPPVSIEPARLRIDASTTKLEVRVESHLGGLRVATARCPAALEVVGAQHAEPAVQLLTLARTALGSARQSTEIVTLELYLGDDPQPYFRDLHVELADELRDADGLPLLTTVVEPGETVVLSETALGRELLFPDRFPFLVDRGLPMGPSFFCEASTEGAEVLLRGAGGPVRVRFRTGEGLLEHIEGWARQSR